MKQKQTIKMNESQLRDIIKESIENILNGEGASETSLEEGFFNNMQGALQGAYNGYKARQSANNARDNKMALAQNGKPQSQRGANYQQMTAFANQLYELAGRLAQLIGGGAYQNAKTIYFQLKSLKTIITKIEQLMQQNSPQKNYDDF